MANAELNSLSEPTHLPDGVVLGIVAAYAGSFVAFGLLIDGPGAVARGKDQPTLDRNEAHSREP